MQKLNIEQIIALINEEKPFEATPPDNPFEIKIESYKPYVCVAVHNGHNLREDLEEKCALSEFERWQEEDPETGTFISSFPLTLIALDSRYEYDLNRDPESAVYEEAWGKIVWKTALTTEEKEISLRKFSDFYRVTDALIRKLVDLFGHVIVYDIHSYNYKRYSQVTPVFNIGSEKIDNRKYHKIIDQWVEQLGKIEMPNISNTVAVNDVFKGNGYLLAYLTGKFSNVLVLATEVKKVYCNESTGELYPVVIESIREGLWNAIVENTFYFFKTRARKQPLKKFSLLNNNLEKALLETDRQLYNLVWNFEIINYVNPVNLEAERKKFFKSKYDYEPRFRYSQLNINPFDLRRQLYHIPVESLEDIHIQGLYKDVINAYADKADIIASIGTSRFMYNSLRYFGKPDDNDLHNANFLLYLPDENNSHQEILISSEEAVEIFRNAAKEYGFNGKIALSSKITAKALVINHKKQLLVKSGEKFSQKDIRALINHEIGIHMLTTFNSLQQPLSLFKIGLPVNDLTQEGLAIFSEYMSGNLSITRLKELALRVIGIDYMIKGYSFSETFRFLTSQYGINENRAFILTARMFRGGGFTKDYVYLKGFREILKMHQKGISLKPLLIGKTSLEYYHQIKEMIDRKLIPEPVYYPFSFTHNHHDQKIINYIVGGIK